jgi:hypothetical protein
MLFRLALVVVAALAGLLGPAAAAPPRKAPAAFQSPEAILRFINGYRVRPEPGRIAEAVRAMREMGLARDQETNGIYVGFLGGAIATAGAGADKLLASLFPMPPEDQVVVVKAIAASGRPDWKELMARFSERMPARKVLIDRYVSGKTPPLAAAPLDSGPAVLDALWGLYFATGAHEPIVRLLSALHWSRERNDVERLTIGSMVKWTLATNASRSDDLLRTLKELAAVEPKASADILREVIEAAETFEVARIRKDQLAAIEDLKRKGPERNRSYAWWTQAGTTLLGLGCVAAAATGQVQFGLPCVIGGPVATAAARYLGPQQ